MAENIDLPNVKDALNEYFILKLKYEKEIMKNKKTIIQNNKLSKREKRSEYLKLKPKCINCGRPGGTKFENVYVPYDDKIDSHRQYSATCGIIADPCNLRIKIEVGRVDLLPTLLDEMQEWIKNSKNDIIDNKNKLLFGYLNSEEVLSKFEDLQGDFSTYNSLYEQYLETYNKLVDNEEKKRELNESITESFKKIDEIKECIKKMNEENKVEYAKDAVTIYTSILQPLLRKIQTLKYNENMIYHNRHTKTCDLIQNRYSIENLSYTLSDDKVIYFEKGLNPSRKVAPEKVIINNEPIYGKDDISWSNPEYTQLWNELPSRLKNALRTNPEWMKEFMANCIIDSENNKPCTIIPPKDLIVPPELMPNGQYNFGVKIYNDVFNNLPKPTQENYAQGNREELISNLHNLVKKEIMPKLKGSFRF
jgi:hypothetical protein